jgi:hypothetical protein
MRTSYLEESMNGRGRGSTGGATSFMIIVTILLSLRLVLSIAAGYAAGVLIVIFILALFWFLYSRLMQKENWARITLGILTLPIGLYILLSKELRQYCRKIY